MDVIDIGNRVFDRLIDKYGEDPGGRLLFLAGCTTGFAWFILNSDKTLTVSELGISANFEDEVITQINDELSAERRIRDEAVAAKFAKELEKGRDRFKDGDTYEFWSNNGDNININLRL
jgi:hypothetical protein